MPQKIVLQISEYFATKKTKNVQTLTFYKIRNRNFKKFQIKLKS